MKKSIIDMVHPRPKYNFRPYWSFHYDTLISAHEFICEKEQECREKFVTSGTNEEGMPFITFESEEIMCELQELNVEIQYLERLIRFRRFWRPRDWLRNVRWKLSHILYVMESHIEKRKEKRLANMSEDKRMAYYRSRIIGIEKKIISLYDKYAGINTDCTYTYKSDFLGNVRKNKKVREQKLMKLLNERKRILNRMFQTTPEEVNRLIEINTLLQKKMEEMKEQVTDFYRANAVYSRGRDLDEWIEISLRANPFLCNGYQGDDFYGSNFEKIIGIEYVLIDEWSKDCEIFRIYQVKNPNYDADHLQITYENQDDDDGTDYWRKINPLPSIKFCHALRHMFCNQGLPLVDILHKTSFSINIKHELKISEQHE